MTKFVGKTRLLALAIGATSAFAAAGGDTMVPFEDTQFDRLLPDFAVHTIAPQSDSAAMGAATSAPVVSAPYEDTQFDRMLPNVATGQEDEFAAAGVAGPTAPAEPAASEQTLWDHRIPDPYLP